MGSQEGREGERNVDVVVLFLAVDVGVNCFVMHNAHNRVFHGFSIFQLDQMTTTYLL
jgi:hypothetical protein